MSDIPGRVAAYPIEPFFLERWSPRAFDRSPIGDDELFALFEAARWAPSSFNHQPWRFVYAHREGADWERFAGLLMPFNAGWARQASVLVFMLSDTLIQLPGSDAPRPSHSHSFDAGAAWAYLALQASMQGLATHGMTGVDFEGARVELAVPDQYRIETAIAIGRRGDKSRLPEQLQGREAPSPRRPLAELAAPARFGATLTR